MPRKIGYVLYNTKTPTQLRQQYDKLAVGGTRKKSHIERIESHETVLT